MRNVGNHPRPTPAARPPGSARENSREHQIGWARFFLLLSLALILTACATYGGYGYSDTDDSYYFPYDTVFPYYYSPYYYHPQGYFYAPYRGHGHGHYYHGGGHSEGHYEEGHVHGGFGGHGGAGGFHGGGGRESHH